MLKRILGSIFALAFMAMAPAFATDLSLDGNLRLQCGTATASGGAATLANKCGTITTETLATANGSDYTLTLTNSVVAAADIIAWSVDNGSNTGGEPLAVRVAAGAGSAVFTVKNLAGGVTGTGAVFNGTLKIKYLVIKP